MPQKETRESIEAELNASKRERIALQLQELVREAHLVENDLRSLEDEHGIPEFARSRPLPERMAAVGMSRAVIDRVQMMLDALGMVRQGRREAGVLRRASRPFAVRTASQKRVPRLPCPTASLNLINPSPPSQWIVFEYSSITLSGSSSNPSCAPRALLYVIASV